MTAMNRSSLAVRHDATQDTGDRRDVVRFANGLPGFEACRGFVLVTAEHGGLQYLTSVEGPPASFLVIDPRRVQSGYLGNLANRAHAESLLADRRARNDITTTAPRTNVTNVIDASDLCHVPRSNPAASVRCMTNRSASGRSSAPART